MQLSDSPPAIFRPYGEHNVSAAVITGRQSTFKYRSSIAGVKTDKKKARNTSSVQKFKSRQITKVKLQNYTLRFSQVEKKCSNGEEQNPSVAKLI